MASDMIKLGGLWSGKDKDGNTFLSGKFSPQVKILIFKNKYRESENHPTHIMYLAQVETQGQGQRQGGGDEPDEFFDDAAFQRGQQRVAQGGHLAPEDVPPPPEEEYSTVRRSHPRPQQARPARKPAPPPDYNEDYPDEERPAPRPEERPAPRTGSGTGRNAPF